MILILRREKEKRTGKTTGIPPLTGFEPSRWALSLRNKFSVPWADFQEMTVAPNRRTSTDSPLGRLAVTRELSAEMVTWGAGAIGDTGMALGFLARSMFGWMLERILGAVWRVCVERRGSSFNLQRPFDVCFPSSNSSLSGCDEPQDSDDERCNDPTKPERKPSQCEMGKFG